MRRVIWPTSWSGSRTAGRRGRRSGSRGAADAVGIQDPLVRRLLHDLTVTLPAFVLSQLTEAFQIGFLLFVPFLVIDLVVSAVLAAMGLFMLPPTLVALPLKLILFVLADGWLLVATRLMQTFAVAPSG